MKKVIGILAEKLDHSLSPVIHNYWCKKHENNFLYKKFEIRKTSLKHSLIISKKIKILGVLI